MRKNGAIPYNKLSDSFNEIIDSIEENLNIKTANKMIKKYIRGHETRGDEVIKELEKLGGVKHFGCLCNYPDNFYIINHKNNNEITAVSSEYLKELIEQTFEEIKLPEEFKPQEFVIVIEKSTNECDGCMFKKGMHCTVGMWFANDCTEKGIIYKLKE